jgi:transcriptional regulator GlxA family with amidase domain
MSRLAQLLLTSDESIDELAMSVGVADGKNLSRQFKARMGMNPKDYRKKYKIVKR